MSKYLAPLRAMFADAVERGDVTVNPCLRLRINAKARRTDETEPRSEQTLTLPELHAIVAAVPEGRDRLLIELLAGTGARISEALGLDWSELVADGDLTTLRIERQYYRGTLKRNAKTEAGERTIDLDADLAAKLWAVGADATGPIFTTRTGERISDRNLRRVLDTACGRVGVYGVGFHTFRHTHGSILIDQGLEHPRGLRAARPCRRRDHRAGLQPQAARPAPRGALVRCEWAVAGQRDTRRHPHIGRG
jgi:integrase